MENKGKKFVAVSIGLWLFANLAIAKADPNSANASDDIESKVNSELEELKNPGQAALTIPAIPKIHNEEHPADTNSAITLPQSDKTTAAPLKPAAENPKKDLNLSSSSPVPLSTAKDNSTFQQNKAIAQASDVNKNKDSKLPNNFDEKFNYFYSQTQRTIKETKEEAEKTPFTDEQDPLKQIESLHPSSPKTSSNKPASATDKSGKTEILSKKNNYSPHIYNRKVYDYRNTLPSPQISKKHYGANNRHLPKVFYQKEYSEYLFIAAINNDVSSIRAFLDKGADINAQDIKYGYTPLMYSILYNKQKSYNYLITKGADLKIKSNDGKTVAHIAAAANNIKAFELLINYGIDPNIRDKEGNTPYYYVTRFTDEFAYIAVKQYKNMNKALIDFTETGSLAAVKQALKLGADTDYKDRKGNTALIITVQKNNVELAGYLLSKGANPLIRNKMGLSAVDYAAMNSSQELKDIIKTVIITKELEGAKEVYFTENEQKLLNNNVVSTSGNTGRYYSRCNPTSNLKIKHSDHEEYKKVIDKESDKSVASVKVKEKNKPMVEPSEKTVTVTGTFGKSTSHEPVDDLNGTKDNKYTVLKPQTYHKENDIITLKAPKVIKETTVKTDSKVAPLSVKTKKTVITPKPEQATKIIVKPQAAPKTVITTTPSSRIVNSEPLALKPDQPLNESKKVRFLENSQALEESGMRDTASKQTAKQNNAAQVNEQNTATFTPSAPPNIPLIPTQPEVPSAPLKPIVPTSPAVPKVLVKPETLSKPIIVSKPINPIQPNVSSVPLKPIAPPLPAPVIEIPPPVVETVPANKPKAPTSLLPY